MATLLESKALTKHFGQTMALATSSFGNELEDKTLGYLSLMPVARWRILLPKVFASLTICGPLLVVSGVW